MTEDVYIIAIVLLLPITASMVLFQTNPYHALVIRGILGALAALVYALLGAADVALTEALVGTMLSITLYAIAVRSSMRMKLGILEPAETQSDDKTLLDNQLDDQSQIDDQTKLFEAFKAVLQPHHLSFEIVPFQSIPDLKGALDNRDLHGILIPLHTEDGADSRYDLHLRIQRLAEIFRPQLPNAIASLKLVTTSSDQPTATVTPNPGVKP